MKAVSRSTGWAPVLPDTVAFRLDGSFSLASGLVIALFMGIIVVLWQSDSSCFNYLPTSEWAFEDSEIRDLQATGLTGEGARVCMVDTGVSLSHFLEDADVLFEDFAEILQHPRIMVPSLMVPLAGICCQPISNRIAPTHIGYGSSVECKRREQYWFRNTCG